MTQLPPDSPDPPPPMNYGSSQRRPFNKRQFFGGLTTSLLTCGICFALLFVAGTYYYEDDRTRPRLWAWLALGTTAVAVVGLVAVAAVAQRRRPSRGFLAGVLLGVGLSGLPLGICFAVVGDAAVGK